MNHPVLIAAGRTQASEDELQFIVTNLIGTYYLVEAVLTADIKEARKDALYICEDTEASQLLTVIPEENLFPLHLEVVSEHFFVLNKVPEGETLYVFNDTRPFADHFLEQCVDAHLNASAFERITFEDTDPAIVEKALKEAKYITGTDFLTKKGSILQTTYKPLLREDVTIFPARRAPSMETSAPLIHRLLSERIEELKQSLAEVKKEGNEEKAAALLEEANTANLEFRLAALQSVTIGVQPFRLKESDLTEVDEGPIPEGTILQIEMIIKKKKKAKADIINLISSPIIVPADKEEAERKLGK